MPKSPARQTWIAALVGALGWAACSSPTKPSGTPTLPTGDPRISLEVSVDGRADAVAIRSLSEVTVKARPIETGESLTYEIDFGDGTPKIGGESAAHVYEAAGTFTVTVRATNRSQGGPTAKADVVVQSVIGAWSHSGFNLENRRVETRWLTIAAQDGTAVSGDYFSSSFQAMRPFTGTLESPRSLRLRLDDQTIEFVGTLPDAGRADGAEMPVIVRGGSASGQTLPFRPVFEGKPPGFDPADGVTISGLQNYQPYTVQTTGVDWIPLTATKVANGQASDCTASGTWSSSVPQIASFGTGANRSSLRGSFRTGVTEIRVNCGGVFGSTFLSVVQPSLSLTVVDGATGQPLPGVDLLGGPGRNLSNQAGQFSLTRSFFSSEVWVGLFRPGYEPGQIRIAWDRTLAPSVTIPMTRPGQLLLEGEVSLGPETFAFTVPRAGTLRLSWYWNSGSDHAQQRLVVTCNGATVYQPIYWGGLYSKDLPVDPSCAYRLSFVAYGVFRPPLFQRFGLVLLN